MSRTGFSEPVSALFGILLSLFGVIIIALAGASSSMIALGLGVLLLGVVVTAGSLQSRSSTVSESPARESEVTTRQASDSRIVPVLPSSPSSRLHDARANESDRFLTCDDGFVSSLGGLTASFLNWFQNRDVSQNLWSDYDRWLRDTLDQCLHARRVRCFRVPDTDGRLVSLAGDMENAFWLGASLPALIQHVLTTGRCYVRGAPGNGELIERLVDQWSSPDEPGETSHILVDAPVWLLPFQENNKTTGLLAVGELPDETLHAPDTLAAVGRLLNLYWHHVRQAERLETAQRIDQASGVLNRADLAAMADKVLYDSIDDGEPIVVLAISVEGLRRLDDERRWVDRDWLIGQIGQTMREKLRSDDLVGRFSDDRFVGVLRRLDISLGNLIAGKLLAAVRAAVDEQPVVAELVQLRCALAEVHGEMLEAVLARVLDALQQARQEQKDIVVVAPHDTPTRRPIVEVTS